MGLNGKKLPPEIAGLADRRPSRWRLRRRPSRQQPSFTVLVAAVVALAGAVLATHVGVPMDIPTLGTGITVVDGDTVRHQSRVVRLVGYDSPETGTRAQCERERALGQKATARLAELIRNAKQSSVALVACSCPPGTEGGAGCNYGRACGVLTVDGQDVGPIMIREGLARPYQCARYSCPPRQSWC